MIRRILQTLAGLRQRGVAVVIALILSFILTGSPAAALNYGEGSYSADCAYSSACESSSGGSSSSDSSASSSSSARSQSSTPTVAHTSTGLDVAINLADGQMITGKTYQIVVTPLNGQGETFKKAEIYLDGKLVFSGAPDADGTLRWDWDTERYPAKTVKVIVFDQDDQPVTKEFSVTLAGKDDVDSGLTTTTTNDSGDNTTSGDKKGTSAASFWVWFGVILGAVLLLVFFILLFARRRKKDDPNNYSQF